MGLHQTDQYTYYIMSGGEGERSPRRRREKEAENLLEERVAKNFPNLRKYMDIQIKEDQHTP